MSGGGPAGEEQPLNAADDHFVWEPDRASGFLEVFANDQIVSGAAVYWDDRNGEAQLGRDEQGRWGFFYALNPSFPSDEFPYRIVSPDDPDDYADGAVYVTRDRSQS